MATSDQSPTQTLTIALELRALGLSIFPVPAPLPLHRPGSPGDGKVPAIAWKECQSKRASEDRLRRWFARPQNIAIVTGAISNVVVVDADTDDAVRWVRRNMLRTPWRVRTSRGYHFYYRWPGIPVRNRAHIRTGGSRLAIDVRGDGGYVVGPGSRHVSGAVYTAEGDWSIPSSNLPAFWIGLLERSAADAPRQTRRPSRGTPLATRARAYLSKIPRPAVGCGSDTATYQAACRLLLGFGLDPDTALSLLQEWAPDFDEAWLRQKTKSALKYGAEPVGGLL